MAKKTPKQAKTGFSANTPKNPVAALKTNKPPIGWYAFLLALVAFAVYINTLKNDYALDDWTVIKYNALVQKGVSAIPEILGTPYHYGSYHTKATGPIMDDLYRPLSLVMFAIEHQLYPDNPVPGHLMNMLIFGGCVVLLFLFLNKLFTGKEFTVAFFAALLFATHPIHTEVVANIKSRDELLCFFFGFSSLLMLLGFADSGKIKQMIAAMCLLFLSLLSKETSVTFVVLIPLIFYFYRKGNGKRSLTISISTFCVTALYLAIRFWVLIGHRAYNPSDVPFIDNALVLAPGFASRLATELLILGKYFKLLLVPYPLVCDYAFNAIPFTHFSDIWVWISVAAYGVLLWMGISNLMPRRLKTTGHTTVAIRILNFGRADAPSPLAFGILFFLITIFIFSNIGILLASEMAERFMFFPSAGFCVALVYAIKKLTVKTEDGEAPELRVPKVMSFILAPIAVLFAYMSVDRNRDWKDNATLYEADSKKSPNDSRLYFFLGGQQYEEVRASDADAATRNMMYREAIGNLRRSIAIYPEYGSALGKLGSAYLSYGNIDSAEWCLNLAISTGSNTENPTNTLANVKMIRHQYPEAIQLFKKCCASDPANTHYAANLGLCYINAAQYDSAICYLKKSIALDTEYDKPVELICYAFKAAGQPDSAARYEARAARFLAGFKTEMVYIASCGYYK